MNVYIPTWAINLAWYCAGMVTLAVVLVIVATRQKGAR
jgi:hypothetical protein